MTAADLLNDLILKGFSLEVIEPFLIQFEQEIRADQTRKFNLIIAQANFPVSAKHDVCNKIRGAV
ncbi:hypothetical protein KKI24_07125 [bacterium]|nr:hypothetical protein [bacterium]